MTVEPDTSFVVLREPASPAEALGLLGDRTYAVLVDESGHVLALGTAADLAEGRALPPGVEIPIGIPLDDVVGGEAVTLLDLNPHGAVVVRDSEVLGVISTAAIDEAASAGQIASRTMGEGTDSALPGDIRVPTARVSCAWPGCGHVNTLTFYDPDRPGGCANPDLPAHTITLSGG
ncbi:hypothetical protein [Amycolatopsis sp. MEPSY49]|uniref:hypothetical protein n=1 Tax=Amycolatopsis sp. MEPSY49 TaxID=3151600 RepID=UPI003EF7ED36